MNANEVVPKVNVRLKRIKTVSKILRTILFATLIIQMVGVVALLVAVPAAVISKFESEILFHNFMVCAAMPFAFMVTLYFFRFFSRLQDGHLFDSQNVRYLEIAGRWWIILGVIQIISGLLEVHLFSSKNIIVSGNGIVAGLAVFFIAWIFREAQELQEEQELTV